MFEPRMTAAQMASMGLLPSDFDDDDRPEPFPDNACACTIFETAVTQWRVGMAGATGLDYTAVVAVMDVMQIKRKERRRLLDQVRVLEATALKCMRKARVR